MNRAIPISLMTMAFMMLPASFGQLSGENGEIVASRGDADLGDQILLDTAGAGRSQLSVAVTSGVYWTDDLASPLLYEEDGDLPVREIYLATAGPTPITGLDQQSGFFGLVDVQLDYSYRLVDDLEFIALGRASYTTDFRDEDGSNGERIVRDDFRDASYGYYEMRGGVKYVLNDDYDVQAYATYGVTELSRATFSERQLRSTEIQVGVAFTPYEDEFNRLRVGLVYTDVLDTSGLIDDAGDETFQPRDYSIGLRYDRVLTPDLNGSLAYQFRYSDYPSSDDRPDENFHLFRGELDYLLMENLSAYVSATYATRSSDLDLSVLNRDTFIIGAGLRYSLAF